MPGQREFEVRQIALERMFRTAIEVIDPRVARVVTRRIVDDWIVAALAGSRAAAYSVSPDGVPQVRVLTLRVLGR